MPKLTCSDTDCQSQANESPELSKQIRRGTTLMEYLMMISLIVVICLVGIGYVGSANNGNMSSSAGAISKSLKKGS